jgi:hypothetical protein
MSCDANKKFFVGKKKNEYATTLLSLSQRHTHTDIDTNTHIRNMSS